MYNITKQKKRNQKRNEKRQKLPKIHKFLKNNRINTT